jgi:hypothetical protein
MRMVEMLVEFDAAHDGCPCCCRPRLLERQVVVNKAIEGSY